MLKNLEMNKIMDLAAEVVYQKGQVVSKTITKSEAVNITLFSFDEGEGLSAHTSSGDAIVQVLDGEVDITIDITKHHLKAGETIVMPRNVSHALYAVKPFKMLLTIVF